MSGTRSSTADIFNFLCGCVTSCFVTAKTLMAEDAVRKGNHRQAMQYFQEAANLSQYIGDTGSEAVYTLNAEQQESLILPEDISTDISRDTAAFKLT